jgi:hypothetical protein
VLVSYEAGLGSPAEGAFGIGNPQIMPPAPPVAGIPP